jgi:adenylate cyclase
MPIEIERKFLLASEGWRSAVRVSSRICQGYIVRTGALSVRIRTLDADAYITIKQRVPGPARAEFEYAIPREDAEALLAHCEPPLIEKIRHHVTHDGHEWTIDEFQGHRAGLFLAECELDAPDQKISLPDWVSIEVTDDPAYRNEAL